MSRAGRSALQGFEYQEMVAIERVIDLLHDDEDDLIEKISVDSVGLADSDRKPDVDDIVIRRESGQATYIQAKKNRTDRQAWSLGDSTLKKELRSARDQLRADPEGEVVFVSRDPFGRLQVLADHCRGTYPNFQRFEQDATERDRQEMKKLVDSLNANGEPSVSEEDAFALIQRIHFEITRDFPGFEKALLRDLRQIVSGKGEAALALLGRFIRKHSTGEGSVPIFDFTRKDVVGYLEKNGVLVTEERSVEEVLDAFDSASKIGRSWLREIDGVRIDRAEVGEIYRRVKGGDSLTLVEGKPGSGKTCVLLDSVERFENEPGFARLFIRADRFADATSTSDLVAEGLPEDIPGQCARLASDRHVVVIIDSLDVLSLSRNHGALKIFLGLIERLDRVPNVSVVAACRTFDRKYDPHLLAMEWDSEVVVEPFDFDENVAPFLQTWNIDPDSLSESSKDLIRVPQNLSLFSKIAKKGKAQGGKTEYELQERFLQGVIVKDDLLGELALHSLEEMADELTRNRSHSLSQVEFPGDEPTKQRLISQGVLYEPDDGSLAFSHQTLGDNLAARKPISDGVSFHDFIERHPPFPFIRPAVRSFFFYLRGQNRKTFRRDVWKVLNDDGIAYHLRRLVVESLCEIETTEHDWPLLRRLFQQHPDLFQRFLQRVQSKKWIDMLTEYWLPLALEDKSETPWVKRYIQLPGQLCTDHANEAIAIWKRAFEEKWSDPEDIAMSIIFAIGRANSDVLEVDEMPDVLGKVVQTLSADHPEFEYPLGQYVSKSIEANPDKHDLLESYLFKESESLKSYGGAKNAISFHDVEPNVDFHRDDFLVDQLKQSDELLTNVIRQVEEWGQTLRRDSTTSPYNRGNLIHTRWDLLRSDNDYGLANPTKRFHYALEDALKHHARENTDWWRENEPMLRVSDDLGIRYMVIQSYRANPAENLSGIEVQVCDTDFHLYSDMNHEIGCLMQEAFPFLSQGVRARSQKSVLGLSNEVDLFRDDETTGWVKMIYDCLNRVPRCFRTKEAVEFLSDWESRFGTAPSQPRVRSYGGAVPPPVSHLQLCNLSDGAMLRLINHFDDIRHSFRSKSGGIVGGRDSFLRAIKDAAEIAPTLFLDRAEAWLRYDVDSDYNQAVYRGVAFHCMYRFGNLGSGDRWEPVRPMVPRKHLSHTFFHLAETSDILWQDLNTARRVVEACCVLSSDTEHASRAILLVFRLLHADFEDIEAPANTPDSDLLEYAHKDAADGLMQLARQCFRIDIRPALLYPLLKWIARHAHVQAKESLLRWLPSLIQHDLDLVWNLLDLVLKDARPSTWSKAEKVLYYTYYQHFGKVNLRLTRLEEEAMGEDSAEMLGRILTLAHLADHVTKEELFERLREAHSGALKGSADVLGTNIGQRTQKCTEGALQLLQLSELTSDAWSTLAK